MAVPLRRGGGGKVKDLSLRKNSTGIRKIVFFLVVGPLREGGVGWATKTKEQILEVICFILTSFLRQHMRTVHEGIKYPCSSCDFKEG